jgi:hypothetical protein
MDWPARSSGCPAVNQLCLLMSVIALLASFACLSRLTAVSGRAVVILPDPMDCQPDLPHPNICGPFQGSKPLLLSFSVILFALTLFHLRMLNPHAAGNRRSPKWHEQWSGDFDKPGALPERLPKNIGAAGQFTHWRTCRPGFFTSSILAGCFAEAKNHPRTQSSLPMATAWPMFRSVSTPDRPLSKQIGKMMLIEDVTNRVQAELASQIAEKQRQSEETYRPGRNISEAIYIVDQNGSLPSQPGR